MPRFFLSEDKKQAMLDPYAFVLAGPNGSGKTSLVNEVKENGLQTAGGWCPLPKLFINPDQVAKDLQGQFPDQNARNEAAASTAVRMRVDAIKSRHINYLMARGEAVCAVTV